MLRFTRRLAAAFASLSLPVLLAPAARAQLGPAPGQLFTSTNDATANEVAVFVRGTDGSLTQGPSVATGGQGSGDVLNSQGAVALSLNLQWLLVVNAGSNDVSVFQVAGNGITLTDREPSGGTRPVSVTIFGSLVYVANAGSPNNVTGFTLSPGGDLSPIANSTRSLSAPAAEPAQVEISPDGAFLVVTERAGNTVDVFPVGNGGLLGPGVFNMSSGTTPFGFGFRGSTLIVSEAFMGATDLGAVSSYSIGSDGTLATVSASVPTTETASCWIAFPPNMLWAYTTNTGSDSVTGYVVGPTGVLAILDLDGVTATTGPMPTDLTFARNTRFLFVLNSGDASVTSYRIQPGGALTPITTAGTLPPMTTVGIAAY